MGNNIILWRRGDAYPASWPQWLREADISWCQVETKDDGVVVWHDGHWLGGSWLGGIWRGGVWDGGEWFGGEWGGGYWNSGVWYDGSWDGGFWLGGEWRGGDWSGGVWHDGVWHDGHWHGGIWLDGDQWSTGGPPAAAPFIHLRRDDLMITTTISRKETPTMTIAYKTLATILTDLGFEVADDAAFVEDVARLVEAGDRDGLIARIIGGDSYGEAAETADEILRRVRGEEPLNEYHVFDGGLFDDGEPWDDGPFYFPSIDEAEAYVRGVLDRGTVLDSYGGYAVMTIRGREDGVWTGESVEVEVKAHDLRDHVLVETMPAALRASHVAAGNIGVYPSNGARRVLMHRADAEELIESDGDWSRIVRAALPEDDGEYDVILDASSFTP